MSDRAQSFALALVLSLAGALLPSCVLAAGAGIGYVISREVLTDSTHEAHVKDDVDRVWEMSRESLEILHDLNTEIVAAETGRQLDGKVDGSRVTITVEAFDYQHSILRVHAEGALSGDSETAARVLNDILARLQAS